MPRGTGKVLYDGTLTYIEEHNINTLEEFSSGLTTKTYQLSNTVSMTFDMSKQGIGSGAGYIELSNGTYTIDSSMN